MLPFFRIANLLVRGSADPRSDTMKKPKFQQCLRAVAPKTSAQRHGPKIEIEWRDKKDLVDKVVSLLWSGPWVIT